MGFLSGLFSSKKLVDSAGKLIDSIPSGIDKAIYTKEEQADDQKSKYQLWLKLQETAAMENSSFSLTRRLLALCVTGFYLLTLTLACILFLSSLYTPTLMGAPAYFLQVADRLTELVWIISVFYFGPGLVDKFKRS